VLRATPFTIPAGQVLRGEGTVKGPLRLASGATLIGGLDGDPGVLTLDGDLTLEDDAEVVFTLLSGAYSRVHVTGDVTLPAHPKLTVDGAADPAAQGAPILTWDGTLTLNGTRWTVTGEENPSVVIDHAAKALELSYITGTLIQLQ
jgi:hypothetical protein